MSLNGARGYPVAGREKCALADHDIIDHKGYRRGVGIVIWDGGDKVLLARRSDHRGWQFPQGGVRPGEPAREAMYRELKEELGLDASRVREVSRMGSWVSYRLPKQYRRSASPRCIGQKQLWWLLKIDCADECIRPDLAEDPEFDGWRWTDYWLPADEVVFFKRPVYRQVLEEFAGLAALRAAGIMR